MGATTEVRPRTATSYIVLVKNEDGSYAPVTTIEAPNDTQAVRKVVGSRQYESGTFVAVPSRSWRERTIELERHAPTVHVT